MTLSAKELGYEKLNEAVRHAAGEIQINDCFGERFIGCGAADKTITINGTPGNAMGAYLDPQQREAHKSASPGVRGGGRPPGDPALYRELCKAVRGFCGNHSGKALLPAEPQRQEPLQAAVYSELTAIPHRCCGVFPTFRRCCR